MQPMPMGGDSAFSCLRQRVKSSLGGPEKTRARLVLKATDHQSDTVRSEELKRLLLEVRDARDGRWLLPKLRERPVFQNGLVAFKCLVVLQRVLQSEAVMDWPQLSSFLQSFIEHWAQAEGGGAHAQLLVEYARVVQSKMELMSRDGAESGGCGKFSGTFTFSRCVAEPSDLLQALALLLSFSEKLMPLAHLLVNQDWQDQSPYARLYLGATAVLLDEAWQLLCAVSVFVRDLLWQVHAAAKFGARDQAEPPWLELALHLLQAQPRFVKFHSSMGEVISTCHQLRAWGFQEFAAPYVIPTVPQALLSLFADFKDLVAGYCPAREEHHPGPGPTPAKAAGDDISQKSEEPPSWNVHERPEAAKAAVRDDISVLSTCAGSTSAGPSCSTNATSWPSAKVLDALRSVDSLQRSPLLAEDEGLKDPMTKGYALLESCEAAAPVELARNTGGAPDKAQAPSWAAAICRRREEALAVAAPPAPLFSTPLWESPPGAAAGVKLEDVEQCHQHKREALGPPAVKNTSACANPFAPIPQADREARDREPRERERSKSPRFQPWPPTAGGGGPRHPPQVGALPGHLEHAPPQALPEALPEWEVDHTELRLEELLGTGSTAEVYRAAWHGTDVAVKKLRSKGQLSMEFKREISVLLRLRHPNLVLFMGACTKAPQALIISEFCAGGTVFALLHHRRQLQLPWRLRLQLALDVAKGMNFLHRRQVVHRDLKSLNLLLLAPVPEQPIEQLPQVKVSDFGLSRAFPDPTQACMTSGAGTYHWMAPEVLSGQGYDEKVDVYSYGICLFELLARRIPYDTSGLEPVSIAVAVSRGQRPDLSQVPQDCPVDLRFIMKCCWAHRPSGRPGFDIILETLKLVKPLE